ncbi:nitrobindin family protein [Rothia uropygialis]|uniref:FABP family protein n=1 Tax=Kocuria sp. 36 TaxID=1415402 RepID=UPI00101CF26A|nr:FABP family protein [Kocuria sp. 36]
MPIEIPTDLTPELVPFAWLLGHWEGVGVLGYADAEERQFGQIVDFTHSGLPYIEYRAESYLLDDEGNRTRPITVETGFWQLDRKLGEKDLGPGLLPGAEEPALSTAADVEKLRNADQGFDILATINHPGGVSELYVGAIEGPRVQMATDAVMRGANAKEYTAASRMFGLVNGELMWAWDMAAAGQQMGSHASARLRKTEVS